MAGRGFGPGRPGNIERGEAKPMTSNPLPVNAAPRASGSIFGIPLPVQMLIGLLVGCIVGLLWPAVGKELLPLAQAFVKALRMLVIPLVFSSITLGVYNMG